MTDKMTDDETLQACCKLMARILTKRAKNFNATNITYKLEDITDKDNGDYYGNIKVEWNNDR